MALFRPHDPTRSHPDRGAPAAAEHVRAVQPANHMPVLLLIIALAALASLLCYRGFLGKYNRGLHQAVAQHVAELFPGATVRIGSVATDGPSNIVANDIRLSIAQSDGQRPVVMIHRAVLHGDLDIANWVQKTICVRQVALHGVRVDVWPAEDGSWSIQSLEPHPRPESVTPAITIHDANLRLFSNATRRANVISLVDIQGKVTPLDLPESDVESLPQSRTAKPPLQLQFACRSSGLLRSAEVRGEVDLGRGSWLARGGVEQLNFSPKLLDSLPPQLAQYFSQLSGLECLASSSFAVSGSAAQPVTFEVQGTITAGRMRDPRLPYPLEELSSNFFCNNRMLQLRDMHATSGGAELVLSSDILGFGQDVPMEIHAQATNLELDGRLRESLPPPLREQWDKLLPSGRVSGKMVLSYDGQRWTQSAAFECQDVAIQPWLFPYPLTNITGSLRYQAGTLSSDMLHGLAAGQTVFAGFSLTRAGTEWYGKISGGSQGPIPIDEELIRGLTPRGREMTGVEKFVRALHPRGSIEVTRVSFERNSPQDPLWHRVFDANIVGGSIRYDNFRYPIYDIRGRLAGQDDSWWLHRFEGHNDSGHILCSGNWRSSKDPGGDLPLDLRFEAQAVPIEDELKQALAADAQAIWDELQPSGTIDEVKVHLQRRAGEALTTRVTLFEESQTNATSGRALRIQPKSFPLWLTDIDCDIEYIPGQVTIRSAAGVNADSRLSLQGVCRPQVDGRWLADVQWQPRTRLIVDGQLLRALPKSIRDSLVRIDFRGPVSILGKSQILFSNQSSVPVQTAWNCQLDVENGQLGDGKTIGALRGTVWAVGSSDGTNLNTTGSVALDSLSLLDLPITRLRGPYAVRENTLYFGRDALQLEAGGAAPRTTSSAFATALDQSTEMTADALTGQLNLTGQGRLDTGKFYLNAELREAELSTLLRDVGVERASTRARCDARLQFSGIPWNSQTWNGEGVINLADAQLFQLPFMIRLLSTASVNADNDSAFQTASIHFEIDGDRIPLQIKCEGDVLRLRGEGWTNLRRDIDLELYSYVGRRPIYSVVSPLLTESRYATFMMIEVSGTLDNPVMLRRPFPQIEATLQQIFPEVSQSSNGIDDLVPWRRRSN